MKKKETQQKYKTKSMKLYNIYYNHVAAVVAVIVW